MKNSLSSALILSLILSVSLALLSLPSAAEEGEFPTGYIHIDEDVETPVLSGTSGLRNAARTDRAYSSVTEGRTGKVKNQLSYSTCWVMSMMTCAEISYRENEGLSSVLDLSAMEAACFVYRTSNDPLGRASKDTITVSPASKILGGGNIYYAMYSAAAWDNAAADSSMPFTSANATKAINGEAGKETDYEAVARVQDVQMLNIKDLTTEERIQAIKDLVYRYGAVSSSLYYKQSTPYQNAKYGTYYYNADDMTPNHMVTIVGWNDDFPASYFGTNVPETDGAWLVQNSWGSGYYLTDGDTDPAKSGTDGYVWISYCNKSWSTLLAAYDYVSADRYQNNYMYDGGVSTHYYSGLTQVGAVYEVNASDRERLDAASFMTRTANLSGTLRIYKIESAEDPVPEGAVPLAEVSFSEVYPGFHTIEIPDGPVFNRGDLYTILFTFDKSAGIYLDSSTTSSSGGTVWLTSAVDCEDDLTFWISSSLKWANDTETTSTPGSLRIKGYTNNICEIQTQSRLAGTESPAFPVSGSGTAVGATILTAEAAPAGYTFEGWYEDYDPENGEYGTKVSAEPVWTARPVKDTVYTAVYSVNADAKLCLTVDAASFTVRDEDGKVCTPNPATGAYEFTPGAAVTVTFTGSSGSFLFWRDGNGNTAGVNPSRSFRLLRSTELKAVTAEELGCTGSAMVLFESPDGSLISGKRYLDTEMILFPELPSGCEAWASDEKTIKEAIASGTEPVHVKAVASGGAG